MKNKLFRKANWYRPLNIIIEGKEYELGNIIFFNENGIIFETGYGYFENDEELEFEGNTTRKIKENFNLKENYIMKDKDSWADDRYKLYIYEKNVKLENTGVIKEYSFIYNIFLINDNIKVKIYIRNLEDDKYKYQDLVKKETEKIRDFCLPLEEKEMSKILSNIKKYNKKILEIVDNSKNYEPKSLEEELKIAELNKVGKNK